MYGYIRLWRYLVISSSLWFPHFQHCSMISSTYAHLVHPDICSSITSMFLGNFGSWTYKVAFIQYNNSRRHCGRSFGWTMFNNIVGVRTGYGSDTPYSDWMDEYYQSAIEWASSNMWRIIPVVDATSARHEDNGSNGDSGVTRNWAPCSITSTAGSSLDSQTETTHCELEDTVTYQRAAFPLDHRIHHSEPIPLYSFIHLWNNMLYYIKS